LWWKVLNDALREHIFVVTLPGMQATERPKMAQMQLREGSPVAKIAIGQNLREEPVN
jgi:hypothetical protein